MSKYLHTEFAQSFPGDGEERLWALGLWEKKDFTIEDRMGPIGAGLFFCDR